MLSPAELQRYSRHLLLPEIGEEGQERLKKASVLVVGAGGLGSPAAIYLAAAGVGRIGLVDFDEVDLTNLHRQVLYGTSDVGRPKLDAARARLQDLNRDIEIVTHAGALTSENAMDVIAGYDIVVDGTDNFPTRYLVNDACALAGKPNVYGSIFRFDGQVSVFDAGNGPCYRCLYPEPPPPHLVPSCAEGGVLGVLPGIVGTIQAAEAIKLITGTGTPLRGRLLLIDALAMRFRELKLRKNPACPLCGEQPAIHQLIDYEGFCNPMHETEITVRQLAERLNAGEDLVLVDVRETYEYQTDHLQGAQHIPLREVPHRLGEIPRDRDVVVYCRSGQRSGRAQQFLAEHGFSRVRNLRGGISAWAREIDPTVRVA
ncbi:MAG TPA: molybdopterin-synthase adenylyltransferase MoeB [Thermoanaerobaculia bacterium]|nr:molybdopterin-synthase adenylyltransferase MoeB [Thermoanaerobaculia bacterium]